MRLRADETKLVGSWTMVDGLMIEDETSRRIRTLIKEQLTPIASSTDGWERLYKDPQDHRLWELTYPSGEMQGGGPPSLRVINEDAAQRKYKPWA